MYLCALLCVCHMCVSVQWCMSCVCMCVSLHWYVCVHVCHCVLACVYHVCVHVCYCALVCICHVCASVHWCVHAMSVCMPWVCVHICVSPHLCVYFVCVCLCALVCIYHVAGNIKQKPPCSCATAVHWRATWFQPGDLNWVVPLAGPKLPNSLLYHTRPIQRLSTKWSATTPSLNLVESKL